MNREFLDLYNTELQLLKEHGKEFAESFPEVAERLGGLLADRTDPMIAGLLEGAAFLAARVQLKMKHEFPEFVNNLLEQLVPNYLAPVPSFMMVQAFPKYGDPKLREGVTIGRGSYLDARFDDGARPATCRYTLTSDLTLYPFEIESAEYYASPASLQALKLPVAGDVAGGLRLTLAHRFAETANLEAQDPAADDKPEYRISGCRLKSLPFHLLGPEAECDALLEQIFANRVGLFFRYLDNEKPVVVSGAGIKVKQAGFGDDEALLDNEGRIFDGFDLLREYFLFPRKFLGFTLEGLEQIASRLATRRIEIVLTFNRVDGRLVSSVKRQMFGLYAQPAINLFEMTTDRVPVTSSQHEFHVVPDRTRTLDYEPYRVTRVIAHPPGGLDGIPVKPLYAPLWNQQDTGLAYTVRRLPRRRSQIESQSLRRPEYGGTDMFISILDPQQSSREHRIAELSVRALCTNRHLPESMPQAPQSADIASLENQNITLKCVAGPSKPRESVISYMRTSSETVSSGQMAWRLINVLSLNHLGLSERGAGGNAQALRELLTVFAPLPDLATERRIRGIMSIETRPVVRRLERRTGSAIARGTEVRVRVDEAAFEGWGAFLLGAVLDRFFCEYAGFNHFTETVIVGDERGEIMRWPARTGRRRSL